MESTWTREIFWNIGADKGLVVYLLGLISVAILFYGLYRRSFLWRKVSAARERVALDHLRERIIALLMDGLFQRRLLREYYPGMMHAFILWGFILLFLGTLTIALQEDLCVPLMGLSFLKGPFYLCFKLVLNIAGIAAVLVVIMALVRRYGIRPDRLTRSPENGVILIWILFILITGFVLEGLRICSLKNTWEAWAIGGWGVSKIVAGLGSEGFSVLSLHRTMWWIHLIAAFGFIAYIAYSKLLHMITSPANIFVRATARPGVLSPILRFDGSQPFGASRITDFTLRQMFDFDACTQCGRCQDNCPAHLSEKPLSPKNVIETLKAAWLEKGRVLRMGQEGNNGKGLLEEDVIWACTLCMACLESCPVYISSFDKIIDLRRDLVLMKSRFFPEVGTFFRNVETFGDTFGKGRAYRENWTGGMDIPKLTEGVPGDLLYWVGCQAAYHDRGSLIAAALAGLFRKAGIDFGVLGKDENCCGDPIRRMGNEYLFQKIAKRNIDLLKRLRFKRIVTYCPHCFNMLKNEYPQLGGDFEVIHYTELLRDLMVKGSLKVEKGMEKAVVYHDPCYLARANGIGRGPREILKAIPGTRLLESRRSERATFCCGAGGGHMWMREIRGKKINEVRLKELG